MTTKKELSYFRLKLEAYLGEHFPERVNDNAFVTARADEALTAYCDAVAQGFSYPEAETMASEVLYHDLHFSKYDTLVSVLEQEFEKELPSPLPERLALFIEQQGNSSGICQIRTSGRLCGRYRIRQTVHRADRYHRAAHRGQWSANDRRREHGLILHHRGLL